MHHYLDYLKFKFLLRSSVGVAFLVCKTKRISVYLHIMRLVDVQTILFNSLCKFTLTTSKGENEINEQLNKMINDDRRIHITPSKVKGTYFLRFAVCAASTQGADVTYAWSVVKEMANKMAVLAKK